MISAVQCMTSAVKRVGIICLPARRMTSRVERLKADCTRQNSFDSDVAKTP